MTGDVTSLEAANGPGGHTPAVPYRRYFWVLTCAWTCAVAGSLAWNLVQHAEETRSLTSEAARTLLEKDLLYRERSIMHGDVYVPKSQTSESAVAPQDRDREIVTPSGQVLELLNPAAMSRQMFEFQNQQTGIRGHITSLDPIRPANAPDAWERQALKDFQVGLKEVSSIETVDGYPYFRMMRPLVTNPACLRCHEERDRRVGSIRGGISVTVPLARFAEPGENARLVVAHAGLWLLGMIGLVVGAQNLRQHVRARQRAEAERERLISELQEALANVKTLRGLIPICSSCKKIRNDQGSWTRLETYLQQHSEAEFSHSLCQDCLRKLYPDVYGKVEARLGNTGPLSTAPPQGGAPPNQAAS